MGMVGVEEELASHLDPLLYVRGRVEPPRAQGSASKLVIFDRRLGFTNCAPRVWGMGAALYGARIRVGPAGILVVKVACEIGRRECVWTRAEIARQMTLGAVW